MNHIKLKICGITRNQDLKLLKNLNIDYSGFIFYKKSPRYIQLNHAKQLITEVLPNHTNSAQPKLVGVFVNEDINIIKKHYDELNLNLIQLHGEESTTYIEELNLNFIKAFRLQHKQTIEQASYYLEHPKCKGILLDSFSNHQYGGTGKIIQTELLALSYEWASTNKVALWIAGGIGSKNIAELYHRYPHTYAFDVSSQVEESIGIKSASRINELYNKICKLKANTI